jgi:acyl-CoA synthetase (AMP-forming)/AMP-acid ligase II
VVLRGRATEQDPLAFVAERVARYKQVRDVRFTGRIPRSPSGRLLRRVLGLAERQLPETATRMA